MFGIGIEDNFIKLIPAKMEPRYTSEELKAIDHIVSREKGKARVLSPGKDFSGYIKKIAG